jgi:HSP20 family molecular chaperone IbpA
MKKIIFSTIATISLLLAQNSVTNDPFSQMDKMFEMQMKQMELMQKQMDEMFKAFEKSSFKATPMMIRSSSILSSGLQDKGDHYEVVINVGKGDVKADVKAKDGILTIKVEQKQEKKENNSSFGVMQSFSSSTFMQSFTLPKDADSNKIDYNIKDGKMVVKIAKVKK